jgi:hypothetical protein
MDHMLASQKIRAVTSLVTVMGLMMLCSTEACAQAILALNPTSVDFGSQRVNIQSDPTALSVSNIGDGSATEISCAVALRPGFNDPEMFTATTCPASLATGGSFTINVTFTPTSVGLKGAQLIVAYHNGLEVTDTKISLDGTGFDAPDLFVNGDWSELNIGNQHIAAGPTVPALEVPMENRHTSSDLTITAFNQIGASCDQFIFSFPSPTPFSLSAGATDFFSAAFNPSVSGASSCDITFTSNDPDPPDTLTVTGIGIDNDTCNVNIVSGVTEYSDTTHEACEILVLGPDFIAADGSNTSVNSGWEIDFMPGFLVEQGATLNANVCGQSLCMTSDFPMPDGCHSCVDLICESDMYCCDTEFDRFCLAKVASMCGLVCESEP